MALTAQQINAFRTRAKAQGFSDDDIAKEIARKQQEVSAPAPQPEPTPALDLTQVTPEPAQPSVTARIGKGAVDLFKGMFEAPRKLGEAVGESFTMRGDVADMEKRQKDALATSERLINAARRLQSEGKKEEAKKMLQLAQKAAGQTSAEAAAIEEKANKGIKKTLKGAAGTAAFLVPGGGSAATRVAAGVGTGALSGYGASREGEELLSTVGGAALGGVISGGMELAGGALAKRAAAKEAAKKSKEVSDLAAQSYARIFQVPKNRTTAGLDPIKTSRALLEYDVKPRNLNHLMDISEHVTGENGALTQAVDEALSQSKDTFNLSDSVTAATRALKGKMPKDKIDEVAAVIRDALPDPTSINAANAMDTLQSERLLSENASMYWNGWTRTKNVEYKYMYDAYKAAADILKNRLDESSAAVIEGVKTADRLNALAAVSKKLAQKFIDAKNVRELRSLQKPFVDAIQLATATQEQATRIFQQTAQRGTGSIVGAGIGGAMGGPVGAVTGSVVGQALSPLEQAGIQSIQVPAITRIAGFINSASKLGIKTDQFSKLAQRVWGKVGGDAVRNVIVSQGVRAATKGKEGEPAPAVPAAPGDIPVRPEDVAVAGATETAGEQPTTVTGYTVAQHMAAASKALAAGDTASYNYIRKQQAIEQEYEKTKVSTKVSATRAKDTALAKSGLRNVQEVETMLNKDPLLLAKTLVPGRLATRKFDSAVFAAVDTLLRLRTGATAPIAETKKYINERMPRLGDSKEVAQYKIDTFKLDLLDALEAAKGQEQNTDLLDSIPGVDELMGATP